MLSTFSCTWCLFVYLLWRNACSSSLPIFNWIVWFFPIVKLLSHVRLFATPWTVALQAPPSVGFSRQEYIGIYYLLQVKGSQFSSVTQSSLTVCNPMKRSTPGLPVHHQLPEFTQTHVLWVSDAIQPSHPLSAPSPPAFNLSQHQGLFKWVSSSHQVAKVLESQLQHQSFQWIFRTDFP